MVFCSSHGPDVTMVPDGNTGHSDRPGPSGSIALKHQYGPKWPHRSQVFICTALDGKRTLRHQCRPWLWQGHRHRHGSGCHLGPCTCGTSGSTCHLGLYGPISNTDLRHQHGSWAIMWPLVATRATDIKRLWLQTQTWQQPRPRCHCGPSWHHRSTGCAWPYGGHILQTLTWS